MTVSVAEKLRQKSTEIVITTSQSEVVDAAESAVLKLGGVFVRARTLVHVVHDVSESHGLVYPTGQPIIARLGRERLREVCGNAATWISRSSKAGKIEEREVQCPPWVAATLLDRGEWRFRALDAISDAPILRPDGTIHDRPGYDAATRTIYEPGDIVYPSIPARPTKQDAHAALKSLLDPFHDFPTVEDTDRAAIVALILTLIARSAIDGCVPLFLARAPTPGSGKGLVIDAAAMIATGRQAPKRPPVTTDDELRKALLAYAMESPAMVVLDNIEGALGSPTLAYVLTAGVVSDRLLGLSENRTVSVRFVMAATGNNVQLRGDTGRRVVPIDLDPGVEHPEDRKGFRYPNLLTHLRVERPRLVAAALTILRAYFAADCPSHGQPIKGSFEAWDRVVRGAVIFAGGADPLGGVQRIRDEGDEDLERLRAFLIAWHETFRSTPHTIANVVKEADKRSGGERGELVNPELHEALAAFCKAGKIESRALGYVLRKLRGRICNRLRLDRDSTDRNGTVRWQVVTAGDGGDAGDSYATRARDTGSLFLATEESPASHASPAQTGWEPYTDEEMTDD